MPEYGPINAVKATVQSVSTVQDLQNGDNAASLLPTDTEFAVVVEAIQKGINDSFYEKDKTSVGPVFSHTTFSPEGMVGRFIGYLSFTESKIRIYQMLDINAAASGHTTQPDMGAAPANNLKLLLEDDIANLLLSLTQGEYVISNATQKFKLLQPYPISNLNGRFESSATGLQNGLSPTFKYLQAHGVQTQDATKAASVTTIIVLVIIVLGVVALFAFK